MLSLATGALEPGPRLLGHLDRCLACRACEAACPSGVPYGELIAGVRAHFPSLPDRRLRRAGRALLQATLIRRGVRRTLARLLRAYQRIGLRTLARRSGLLRLAGLQRLDAMLPQVPPAPRWKSRYPAVGRARGTVALFTGCMAEEADRETLQAAIHVLTALGYEVRVPERQTCCGALHLHGGELAVARRLARRNVAAFGSAQIDRIVTTASGCAATLLEYPRLLGEEADGTALSGRLSDISDFLADVALPPDLELAPLPARVAVHDPCSLAHVLRRAHRVAQLLGRVPQIELVPLAENRRCCGGAGSYLVTQPELAEALRCEKLGHLNATGARVVVTSNPGCALQLRQDHDDTSVEVLHPVTLLARQLRRRTS